MAEGMTYKGVHPKVTLVDAHGKGVRSPKNK